MSRWAERGDIPRGAEYDDRWARKAARGESIHGEADLVDSLLPRGGSVLDAGCGTGRVAIELARRGHHVVGVDLDPAMLDLARDKAPELVWIQGDLASTVISRDSGISSDPGIPSDIGTSSDSGERRLFDAAVAAGNVMIFLERGTEAAVMANIAAHLRPGGVLVAGFQLSDGYLALHVYDALAERNGLELDARYSTWEGAPFDGGDYAVSVHRLTG
ncbi:class I SAM-dependent methyltransferase [Candidatus Poriferisodalis sp.]|uniref:class I SAM-dependent methyltransferase n=1 Tax=Candidatus Poriferisodalis sp. TaxID=3101277 RepID=UPI003B01072E